jgi:RNA polymerase sigma-70 factor (ECF subfamily)
LVGDERVPVSSTGLQREFTDFYAERRDSIRRALTLPVVSTGVGSASVVISVHLGGLCQVGAGQRASMQVMDGMDAEVIKASWSDPSRFGVVFERHYRAVFAYVVRTVGYQDGPDVTAEVFEQAFRSRRRYDTSYPSARGWLLGIAAHLVAGYHRNRGRRRLAPVEDPVVDFADEVTNRVDAARSSVGDAMRVLRPFEREVVSLFVFGGLSYQEVADSLGVPVGTVRSRLSRAKRKLRNSLAGWREYTDEGPEATDE